MLREQLAALTAGRGGVVAVTGAAGVGKTRLVEVALDAVPGLVAVWGRCVEGDAAPPLWPWLQVAGSLGSTGSGLAAVLRQRAGSRRADRADADREAVEAIGVAGGVDPLVVVLDDLQWADDAAHRILQLLLSRLAELRVLVIAIVRDDHATNVGVDATLAAIARSRVGRRIELVGLEADAIRHHVWSVFGAEPSDAAVAVLQERTGGNAFYLSELLRVVPSVDVLDDPAAVARLVPATVRDVVVGRLGQLPAAAAQVVTAAAVLGREFDWRVAQSMLGLDTDACLDAIDIATVSGFIEQGRSATRLQFCHDLVREAVVQGTPPMRRTQLHADALVHLEARYAIRAGHLDELAAHAWEARGVLDPIVVIDWMRETAIAAIDALAFEQAERMLLRGADLLDDIDDAELRNEVAFDLFVRLARLSRMIRGSESPVTITAFARVRTSSARPGPRWRRVDACPG